MSNLEGARRLPGYWCSLVTTIMLLLGISCTRAIDVPPTQLQPRVPIDGLHKISTDSTYYVRQFLITDSTVVITKLSGADTRYGSVHLPIILDATTVHQIARLETNTGQTVLLVSLTLLAVVAIAIYANTFPATFD